MVRGKSTNLPRTQLCCSAGVPPPRHILFAEKKPLFLPKSKKGSIIRLKDLKEKTSQKGLEIFLEDPTTFIV